MQYTNDVFHTFWCDVILPWIWLHHLIDQHLHRFAWILHATWPLYCGLLNYSRAEYALTFKRSTDAEPVVQHHPFSGMGTELSEFLRLVSLSAVTGHASSHINCMCCCLWCVHLYKTHHIVAYLYFTVCDGILCSRLSSVSMYPHCSSTHAHMHTTMQPVACQG